MDIFESLENLEISEECFNDIMGIVENAINEYQINRTAYKQLGKNTAHALRSAQSPEDLINRLSQPNAKNYRSDHRAVSISKLKQGKISSTGYGLYNPPKLNLSKETLDSIKNPKKEGQPVKKEEKKPAQNTQSSNQLDKYEKKYKREAEQSRKEQEKLLKRYQDQRKEIISKPGYNKDAVKDLDNRIASLKSTLGT